MFCDILRLECTLSIMKAWILKVLEKVATPLPAVKKAWTRPVLQGPRHRDGCCSAALPHPGPPGWCQGSSPEQTWMMTRATQHLRTQCWGSWGKGTVTCLLMSFSMAQFQTSPECATPLSHFLPKSYPFIQNISISASILLILPGVYHWLIIFFHQKVYSIHNRIPIKILFNLTVLQCWHISYEFILIWSWFIFFKE